MSSEVMQFLFPVIGIVIGWLLNELSQRRAMKYSHTTFILEKKSLVYEEVVRRMHVIFMLIGKSNSFANDNPVFNKKISFLVEDLKDFLATNELYINITVVIKLNTVWKTKSREDFVSGYSEVIQIMRTDIGVSSHDELFYDLYKLDILDSTENTK